MTFNSAQHLSYSIIDSYFDHKSTTNYYKLLLKSTQPHCKFSFLYGSILSCMIITEANELQMCTHRTDLFLDDARRTMPHIEVMYSDEVFS
jgi:hypothetical protein